MTAVLEEQNPTEKTPDVPSNADFASEVKADRLNLLWQVTFGVGTILCLFSLSFGLSTGIDQYVWSAAPAVMGLSAVLTYFALKREYLDLASQIFTFGNMVVVCVAMLSGTSLVFQLAPFMFVVIIFIGGLLLSPITSILMALVSSIMTVLIPFSITGNWDFLGEYQVFAIILTFMGALLGAQVTGDLYAIAEWALQNYQRERRTNLDLFESRNQLHRSLKRSEALSERLKETNIELDEARQAAETAKKFRGQFLANMSHELRTPLNAIIGFSETMLKFPMMYDNEELPDTYKTDLRQIYNSGQQLLHLINDILDLARVDAGKLEIYRQRVELKPIIDAVTSTPSRLIGSKPIELHTDLPDPLPDVWADESRVRQVLLNLYSNATKFTDAGKITLRIHETDEGVQFSIQDTGSGISQGKLEEIFEEFEQAGSEGRDPRAGSGLGLAISRQLLTLMGGRIWAKSTVNRGSIFYFVIPPYHKEKIKTVETKSLTPANLNGTKSDIFPMPVIETTDTQEVE